MRPKSTTKKRTDLLMGLIKKKGLKTLEQILSKEILEEVIRCDHATMKRGAGQQDVNAAVRDYRKLCKDRRSNPYRAIQNGKRR
jgi:hypothetical protein